MYTKIEYKTKTIETKTYKQLTKKSLIQLVKDIKTYCDKKLMVMVNPHGFDFIPIPQELIKELLLTNKESDNYYIHTKYKVFKRNPEYDPNYREDENNQELQLYWHTRWENDYEGTYSIWENYLELIITNYLHQHEDEYTWEIIKVIENIKEED